MHMLGIMAPLDIDTVREGPVLSAEGAVGEELLVRQSPKPRDPGTAGIVELLQYLTHATRTPPGHSFGVELVDGFARQARRSSSSKHAPHLLELPAVPERDMGK